jgi:hypothetical protein
MRCLSILTAALIVLGTSFVVPATPAAAYTSAQRAAIRRMPIEQRPNRPGHVYGNTVRRLNRLGW